VADLVERFFRDPVFRFRCYGALAVVGIGIGFIDQPHIAIPTIVAITVFVELAARWLKGTTEDKFKRRWLGLDMEYDFGALPWVFGVQEAGLLNQYEKSNLLEKNETKNGLE